MDTAKLKKFAQFAQLSLMKRVFANAIEVAAGNFANSKSDKVPQ